MTQLLSVQDPTTKTIDKVINANVFDCLIDIYKPLEEQGINSFFYSRFHEGNRVNLLTNNAAWLEHLKNNLMHYPSRFENQFHFRPGFSIDYLNYFKPNQMAQDMFAFNMRNAIYLTNVSADRKSTEVFMFTCPESHEISSSKLSNSIPLLSQYALYFKDKADDIIRNTQLTTSDLMECRQFKTPPFKQQNIKHDIKRYFLGAPNDDVYLTNKELVYLKDYLQGKSVKTIANNFSVSPRTIEDRLQIIKKKLHCNNKFDLMKKILCSQLAWFMMDYS